MKKIMCEVCENEEAYSFSFFDSDNYKRICKLTGECTIDSEKYYIEFKRFFNSPQSMTNWIAHMSEKQWFNKEDFITKLIKFRTAGDM